MSELNPSVTAALNSDQKVNPITQQITGSSEAEACFHIMIEPHQTAACVLFPLTVDSETQTLHDCCFEGRDDRLPVVTFQGALEWAFETEANLKCEYCSAENTDEGTRNGITRIWNAANPGTTGHVGDQWRAICEHRVGEGSCASHFATSMKAKPNDLEL